MDFQDQKDKWTILGKQLNHIITEEELRRLLTVELPNYRLLEVAEEGVEVDLWWSQVADSMLGGERQFPILSRLALCTICNSSSEVERDFSDMEAIYADSRANATGQKLLEAKKTVKSAVKQKARKCARCQAYKEDRKKRAFAGERLPREQCNHCHCSFLEVDEELLADLQSCGPHQRFEQSEKKAAVGECKEKSDAAKKKKKEDYEVMLRKETLLMRRRFQEKKALEKELEKKAAEKEEKRKAIGTEKNKVADGKEKKKAGKRRGIKRVAIEKQAADDKKKKKLSFLKDTEGNLRSKEQEKVVKEKDKVVNEKEKVVKDKENVVKDKEKVAKEQEKVVKEKGNVAKKLK